MKRNVAEKVVDLIWTIKDVESEIKSLKKVRDDGDLTVGVGDGLTYRHNIPPYVNLKDVIDFIIEKMQNKLDSLNEELKNL